MLVVNHKGEFRNKRYLSRPMAMVINTIYNTGDCQRCVNLPIQGFTGYISWGDGKVVKCENESDLHYLYPSPGEYEIKIQGECIGFKQPIKSELGSLVRLVEFGALKVMFYGQNPGKLDEDWGLFKGRYNFTIEPNDKPTFLTGLSGVGMFNGCTEFNSNINHWDVSSLITLRDFFKDCRRFNQPLNKWDVSLISSFTNTFRDCARFNQNIARWNMVNAKVCDYMFAGAFAFNQPIGSWNLSAVIYANSMFEGASSFAQDISAWQLRNVERVDYMFARTSAFDKSVSIWGKYLKNIKDATRMFFRSGNNSDLRTWDLTGVRSDEFHFQSRLQEEKLPIGVS